MFSTQTLYNIGNSQKLLKKKVDQICLQLRCQCTSYFLVQFSEHLVSLNIDICNMEITIQILAYFRN